MACVAWFTLLADHWALNAVNKTLQATQDTYLKATTAKSYQVWSVPWCSALGSVLVWRDRCCHCSCWLVFNGVNVVVVVVVVVVAAAGAVVVVAAAAFVVVVSTAVV